MTRPYKRGCGCSKCGRKNDRDGQRYCSLCHAKYQKAWRTEKARKLKRWARAVHIALNESPFSNVSRGKRGANV